MKPWTDIGKPEVQFGYASILANPEHPFDFYWGRDADGCYTFRFMGHFSPDIHEDAPVMHGIEVKGGEEGERSHLTLVLESSEDAKIFYYLCISLMEATEKIEEDNDESAARVVLTHLGRWQSLLGKRRSHLMTLSEQTGLFGELLVLRDIFIGNLPPRDAVSSWTGPMGDEQDFGYGNSLVEVKTVRSTRDREISISSIAQLDPISGKISLVFQTVGIFEDKPPESMSLNELVSNITSTLHDTGNDVMDQLGMRLAMVGYESHPEYEKYHFAPVTRRIFAVEGDFPRIGSGDIRPGIEKASYSIRTESCLPFELTPTNALKRILEGLEGASIPQMDAPPEVLVKLDESHELEFKSSLRYCQKTKQAEKYIEGAVLKTIAAFANSAGGKLVIGVSDEGRVNGLANDYGTLRQRNRDGFELHLSNKLVETFGEVFSVQNTSATFHTIGDEEICIVAVMKSLDLRFIAYKTRTGVDTKKLFVRVGNSSREVPPDQIQEYIAGRDKDNT